jgi:hypothetical protein
VLFSAIIGMAVAESRTWVQGETVCSALCNLRLCRGYSAGEDCIEMVGKRVRVVWTLGLLGRTPLTGKMLRAILNSRSALPST